MKEQTKLDKTKIKTNTNKQNKKTYKQNIKLIFNKQNKTKTKQTNKPNRQTWLLTAIKKIEDCGLFHVLYPYHHKVDALLIGYELIKKISSTKINKIL